MTWHRRKSAAQAAAHMVSAAFTSLNLAACATAHPSDRHQETAGLRRLATYVGLRARTYLNWCPLCLA
jgi:hypothetical protein